ncbi:MAG: hypothetical protein MUC56_11935 [Thermoanaerobaculales bacterium]|nr:hypothetical protein [Thermoanaerobaculales bacterium]
MTLIFIAMLLAAIALDVWVIRPIERRSSTGAGGRPAPAVELVVPRTLFFHPGHSWARLDGDGTVTVGVDDLLLTLVGGLTAVGLPGVGDRVTAGRPALSIRGGDQELAVPSPISGRVVAVNSELGRDAARLRWRPYKEGWAYRVVPGDRLAAELAGLVIGRDAERWMAREIRRVDRLFASGVLEAPVAGSLQRAGSAGWAAFTREILGAAGPAAEAAP